MIIHIIMLCRISRGVEFHSLKLLSFKAGRDEAKAATLAGQPCLLFLTFSSHEEAAQVKSEISKRPISCIKSPGVSILMSYGENPHYVNLPIFSEFMENSTKFMKNSGLTKWTQNLR